MTHDSATLQDSQQSAVETAVSLLDKAVSLCGGRDIVPAGEMTDILLDVRNVLTAIGGE